MEQQEAKFVRETEHGLLFSMTPHYVVPLGLDTVEYTHVLMVTTIDRDDDEPRTKHRTVVYGANAEGVATHDDWLWSTRSGCVKEVFNVMHYKAVADE